jgi:hypothetical protein
LPVRARCLLGYNFVKADLLRPLLACGGAGEQADGVPSLDVELGGAVAGGGGGGGGAGAPVQFTTVADAQKIFWEYAMSKHAVGGGGGSGGEGRGWPVLLLVSAESLVRLALHSQSTGGLKGGGGGKGGGGDKSLVDLLVRMSGRGRGGGDKSEASGAAGGVRFVVLGSVYRSLRVLQDSCGQEDQRAIAALLSTALPKAVESGCLCFVDGGASGPEADLRSSEMVNGANGATGGGINGKAAGSGGGRAGARGGGAKVGRPLSSWKASLTQDALLASAAQLSKSCRHVVAQNRAEGSWKTDPVVLVVEDREALAAAKAAGVPAISSEVLVQQAAGKGLGKFLLLCSNRLACERLAAMG